MLIIDRGETRCAFVPVRSEADQDRTVDALSPLDRTTPSEEGREVAEQLVVVGHSAVVSVITPITVTEAMRTISVK